MKILRVWPTLLSRADAAPQCDEDYAQVSSAHKSAYPLHINKGEGWWTSLAVFDLLSFRLYSEAVKNVLSTYRFEGNDSLKSFHTASEICLKHKACTDLIKAWLAR